MYEILKNIILRGDYSLDSVSNKINTLWGEGKITDEQREELLVSARANAKAGNGVDLFGMIAALELRVKALEDGTNTPIVDTPPEYNEYKVYHKGDEITFKNKVYVCTAPDGMPCTWSPEGYPAYWEVKS